MPELIIDRRDIDFVLYEQFQLQELLELDRYKELGGKETLDMVLTEAIKLATEHMAPHNAAADREGCRMEGDRVKVPESFKSMYAAYREGGWIAPIHSPEFGGMGLPQALGVMLGEIFISACSSFYFIPALTSSAGHLIEAFASDDLKNLLVPKMYGGEWTGTMCLTEPHAGTAVGDIRTTATPVDGTNRYKISGQKILISAGDHDVAENIIHLVLARVPGDPAGTKGISLFAVPRLKIDEDGNVGELNDVKVTALEHKMGIHAAPTCALAFGEDDGCEGYLIGERSRGIVYMFQMMNEARVACGVQGSASANTAYQWALAFAKERVQGTKVTDRSPDAASVAIIEHPDVRRNLLLCKAQSEGLRALLVQAAIFSDRAHNHPDEAVRGTSQDLLDLLTPVCKAYATDIGFDVTRIAMQVHGGYGYCSEYGVEQCMRDVKIASIYEGTNGVQALDLVGRKMRMKGGGLFMSWIQEILTQLEPLKSHERLGDLAEAIDKAKNALGTAAFGFSEKGKSDPELAILGATPFLEMFGHVHVATLLLQQAAIADTRLQEIIAAKEIDGAEDLAKLIAEHDEARFYDGKIKSARFFVSTVLPRTRTLGAELKTGDRTALDFAF